MKGTRKKYYAKFKAKLAIEAIKERETLSELAAKYEVSPVMISRWKKEFIENSAAAFESPRHDDEALEKQKDRYLRKIGDAAGFCKAGIQKIGDRDTRRRLISPKEKLSISKQCEILDISRSAVYYTPKGESAENLEMMRKMDEEHIGHPEKGVIQMTDFLLDEGHKVGQRRVRRLMRLMGIQAIYPKKHQSVPDRLFTHAVFAARAEDRP